MAGQANAASLRSAASLVDVIVSEDDLVRNRALDEFVQDATLDELCQHTTQLESFFRSTDNLYHRVRALFFLSAIHRYHLPQRYHSNSTGLIPFASYQHLLGRRFIESIDSLLAAQQQHGPSDALSSALAQAYHELAFQTLADQVRTSVRSVRGNQWMFRTGHPADHPLRFRPELLEPINDSNVYPVLSEKTSVRMDFSHSGWSDIFFLGMDYPAGARVVNGSIDLGVRGRDDQPRPPIECFLRVIDEPVLRLVSVDLNASAEVTTIAEVFDFARDYLGLLKAAVIASGIVPPGMEGCQLEIGSVLRTLLRPKLGLELVSKVNDIPKGSRLAVSTNLLGSLISLCMRATHQTSQLEGGLAELDRRIVAARAILGEWLGGSGGGWQDSGGVWPGIKLIEGATAEPGDPEYQISRGRLLPQHTVFDLEQVSLETRQKLQNSLILVHGGMAQNVGPILEMVTERYLLRSSAEWEARQDAISILEQIIAALHAGDIRQVGELTNRNFYGPLQTIIPWCTNEFTNAMVKQCQDRWGNRFWGFWMLGGMSGGGMGFIFDPEVKPDAQDWLQSAMLDTKRAMEDRLPFAMDPVVYDFAINDKGTWADLDRSPGIHLPHEYYAQVVPDRLKQPSQDWTPLTRYELEQLGGDYRSGGGHRRLFENLLPAPTIQAGATESLDGLLVRLGFDHEQHEQIRADLLAGRFGLAQNRLPSTTNIEDVRAEDVVETREGVAERLVSLGNQALSDGLVGVVTLAAGVGSRWTDGAGVVKGLHPFCQMGGQHRSFIELHLAKSRRIGQQFGTAPPHIITTGYLTHDPIQEHLKQTGNFGYSGDVLVSPGKYVGLRMIPTARDLRFAWEEMPQQMLDEQQQKVRESLRSALLRWAQQTGEAADYRDNTPMQCLHPVGHWYEFPNMLRNGTLARLLDAQPQLKYLMLHNVDTLGASIDPALLGLQIDRGACLSFEVTARRLEDRGGGLARIDGRPRLVESLAMPREEDEFRLSYYNSNTTWIDIDLLLEAFGLTRSLLFRCRGDRPGDSQTRSADAHLHYD